MTTAEQPPTSSPYTVAFAFMLVVTMNLVMIGYGLLMHH